MTLQRFESGVLLFKYKVTNHILFVQKSENYLNIYRKENIGLFSSLLPV